MEKTTKKYILSIIILIIIILIGSIFLLKIKNTGNTNEIANINTSSITNTVDTNEISKSDDEKIETIVLDGVYSEGGTGYVYEFYEDGTVIQGDEFVDETGTYITTGKNQVKVVLIQRTTLSDMDTGEETKEDINETYEVIVIDEDTLRVKGKNDNGEYGFEITRIED